MRNKCRWGDMHSLSGGWSGRKDPRGRLIDGEATEREPDRETVPATIDFATYHKKGDLAPKDEQIDGRRRLRRGYRGEGGKYVLGTLLAKAVTTSLWEISGIHRDQDV